MDRERERLKSFEEEEDIQKNSRKTISLEGGMRVPQPQNREATRISWLGRSLEPSSKLLALVALCMRT